MINDVYLNKPLSLKIIVHILFGFVFSKIMDRTEQVTDKKFLI